MSEVRRRAPKHSRLEVLYHDERVAVPSSARHAHPEPDGRADARRVVERHDPVIVDHLVDDDHGVGRLEDFHVVVVRARDHRRSRHGPAETTFLQRPVEVRIEAQTARATFILAVGGPQPAFVLGGALPFGRQRRNAPVRRIDQQRRAACAHHFRAVLPPDLVVRAIEVGASVRAAAGWALAVTPVPVLDEQRLPFEGFGLGLGQKGFTGELGGTFERRQRRVAPDSLQIRSPVARSRRRAGAVNPDESGRGNGHERDGSSEDPVDVMRDTLRSLTH
jgi:hypothetical protein